MGSYVIGIDYGSDSCRSVVLDVSNGEEIGGAVFYYPRWAKGMYCKPNENIFRQHPLDYIEGLEYVVKEGIKNLSQEVISNIKGISIDTTGSTPIALDKDGNALALLDEFKENPNAMFVLWKDHSSIKEADEINFVARHKSDVDYTKYIGGVYSSEWFWAKMLHVLREDEKVREKAYTWVEHCDWLPAFLTGNTKPQEIKRGRCAAGHKGMWNEEFGGYPPNEFFVKIDPLLDGIVDTLGTETYTSEHSVGIISKEWADKLGLPETVSIGIGAFDCHMGAVGSGAKAYSFVKIIGTSTCDILIAPKEHVGDKLIGGICGQVDGSVVENMIGMEAGQSAFGDYYAWYKKVLTWPILSLKGTNTLTEAEIKNIEDKVFEDLLPSLTKEAEKISTTKDSIIAMDWINGRRTPYANQNLKAAIVGLSIGTEAPHIFKAIVEATAFGAKKIVDRFIEEEIRIDEIIATGGVAKKSPFIMQTLANVMNKPIKVARSLQTVARGAAIFAAIQAGIYKNAEEAQKYMLDTFEKEYYPQVEKVEIYKELYNEFEKIGNFLEKEIY
ncbi:MAG: ribulokinase [Fusobacteriaceae bacterium]|nr:ribulokinase [Fusobacteriaceae bacterium]